MRGKTLFAFILLVVISHSCRPQRDVAGYDQYRLYKKLIYIDNILQDLIPLKVNEFYYSLLKDKDLSKKYQEYDTIRREHNIYVFTKKAKDGYLNVNKGLMTFIASNDSNEVEVKSIRYIIDDEAIIKEENIAKLLALEKRKIKNVIYDFSNETDLLSVKIITR
ncbi:hypothetical protein ACFOET_05530 [Parapedobacter deserti]|uniref:Uncharacterized protein n=1 Tax=Parapedobacter deserti TaxID=1912957 RepID=A0ABV7JJM5_9SPHI